MIPQKSNSCWLNSIRTYLGLLLKLMLKKVVSMVSSHFQDQMLDDVKEKMQQDVTDQTIQQFLFGIGNEKAPGPDGLIALFLKTLDIL